jgi:hypothetical protein
MILPDGSAFGVMSFPLPDDHWLYAPNEYKDGEYEPIDLPKPILTHALSDAVVAAVRYAVRGATMRGQETDFDPDALVQNAVYALCGPYATPPQRTEQEPVKYSDYEPDGVHHNKPQQEPVAWEQFYPDIGKPQLTYPPQGIYYTPPQRTWVGLTDEEIDSYFEDQGWSPSKDYYPVIKAIEAKLKEKNT